MRVRLTALPEEPVLAPTFPRVSMNGELAFLCMFHCGQQHATSTEPEQAKCLELIV
jgi:hypothetical protein